MQHLIKEVIHLIHLQDWQVTVNHIPRQTNNCADAFATQGQSSDFSLHVFHYVSSSMSLIIDFDKRGGCSPLSVA